MKKREKRQKIVAEYFVIRLIFPKKSGRIVNREKDGTAKRFKSKGRLDEKNHMEFHTCNVTRHVSALRRVGVGVHFLFSADDYGFCL